MYEISRDIVENNTYFEDSSELKVARKTAVISFLKARRAETNEEEEEARGEKEEDEEDAETESAWKYTLWWRDQVLTFIKIPDDINYDEKPLFFTPEDHLQMTLSFSLSCSPSRW